MSDPQTILITGATGQVGGELLRLFPGARAPGRNELDLSSETFIRNYVQETKPRWILNPAAYTAVDKAESEPEAAYAINAEAPRILGEEARKIGAAVVHFSTDYVFDGSQATSYRETDPTGPLGVYGTTKLAGEQALTATGAAHVILRTSWVYGATGKNFLLTILKMAAQKPELKIVADQHGAPTWARDLALLTAHLVAQRTPETLESGVYHATSQGETTWFGFASEGVGRSNLPARLIPISTADYPTPAKRPHYSRLNCEKLADTFNFRLPAWDVSLGHVLTLWSSSDNHA